MDLSTQIFCSALVRRIMREAKLHLENGLQKFPSDDALWRALGVVEEKLGNISAAIAAHQKATELNQNHPSSYIELAGIMRDAGRVEEADAVMKTPEELAVQHPLI